MFDSTIENELKWIETKSLLRIWKLLIIVFNGCDS